MKTIDNIKLDKIGKTYRCNVWFSDGSFEVGESDDNHIEAIAACICRAALGGILNKFLREAGFMPQPVPVTSQPVAQQPVAIKPAKYFHEYVERAAATWCNENDRLGDYEYFKHKWSAMPGLWPYVIRAAIAHSATPAPVEAQEPVAFGLGRYCVDTGEYNGVSAVFIAPAKFPGEVGASAKREGRPLDALVPGERVLTFPTLDQAKRVADALCNAHPATPAPVEAGLIEAAQWARNRLEIIADESWRGDGRDLKRSIIGVFADFDEALARCGSTVSAALRAQSAPIGQTGPEVLQRPQG